SHAATRPGSLLRPDPAGARTPGPTRRQRVRRHRGPRRGYPWSYRELSQAVGTTVPLVGSSGARSAAPMDGTAVEVRVVTSAGVQARSADELPALLRGSDPVWIDIPNWDDEAAAALVQPLGLHAGAVRECAERNPLPKVHIYP